ncbi:MAG: TonB-dependent receptor [Bacteroidota bacterium]
MRKLLETEQKALELNLDTSVYGTFAEIGAGQEVARYFFQVGAAAGTIAKTMSAYDKVYSDQIYGVEPSGRYVCESRLYRMLDHEYELIDTRLSQERLDTNFFVFADTIAAINYSRTIKGDGWLGIRFQLHPDGEANDLVIHVKMLDRSNQLQAQAIGVLGVNLVYACFRYHDDPETLVESLIDNLRGRVKIDMIRLTGPDFDDVDNRLLSLLLVKHGLTDVAIFGPDGKNLHGSEFLYRKNLLIVPGSFRPPTLVNMDMIKKSYQQFRNEADIDEKKTFLLTELTLDNLMADGALDYKDFLDRAKLLNALGQTVMISNNKSLHNTIAYFSDFKVPQVGIVIGVHVLLELINNKYYENMDGRLLAAFGELFAKNVRMYVYPAMQEGSEELMTSENLPIPEGVKFLVKHLIENHQITDVQGANRDYLQIFSTEILKQIQAGESGWEQFVPPKVAKLVKGEFLFGFPTEQMEFEY